MLRLWRDRDGTTALEAGFVVPIVIVFVAMMIQIAIMFFMQAMLDNATRDAARLIAIGNIQGGGAAAFVAEICNSDGMSVFIPSCASKLQFSVISGNSFAGFAPGSLSNQFSPGGPGQAVFVQVGYSMPPMFNLWPGGWPLVSSVAIQNELYQ